jgi:hypothetical protein
MVHMRDLPDPLTTGPFTRGTALAHGVTSRMLQGRRFVRVFPDVWRAREHGMTEADWVEAARLPCRRTRG